MSAPIEQRESSTPTIRLDGHSRDLGLTFSVRSILTWTTIFALHMGGYVRWHLISFAVFAAALPVGGLGIGVISLGVLLAARCHGMRGAVGDLLVMSGATVMMLSATMIGIGLVNFTAELFYWVKGLTTSVP